MTVELFDKHGVQVQEYDLIKVYHFTGTRRKRHYMYKWVIKRNGFLYGFHLEHEPTDGIDGSYRLTENQMKHVEIIQGNRLDYRNRRAKEGEGSGE